MSRTQHRRGTAAVVVILALVMAGCATGQQDKSAGGVVRTSGSREADQRAEQRIAKTEQIRGQGEGSGKPGEAAPAKKSLYERLGGLVGIQRIVDDFVERVIADPRVNFERKGVQRTGALGIRRGSAEWKPTSESVGQLKKHFVQFISLASGGPPQYDGRDMRDAHKGMRITNAEFDAAVGDLQATLDKLGIPTEDQRELLAVIESTRPQIVEQR